MRSSLTQTKQRNFMIFVTSINKREEGHEIKQISCFDAEFQIKKN